MNRRVVLIGGSSHVGKSTLGQALAHRLNWDYLSTDELARHPGRPWRDDQTEVPADVVGYYSSRDRSELVDDVLTHYKANVWPIAQSIVCARLNNPFDLPLVMEGSAILPDQVAEASFSRVLPVLLLGSADLLTDRIRSESRYAQRSEASRALIDAFTLRSIDVDVALRASHRCPELQILEAAEEMSAQALVEVLVDELAYLS